MSGFSRVVFSTFIQSLKSSIFLKVARDKSGASAVEFALVLPMLLMLSLGVWEGALVFYTQDQMSHVSREASRNLALGLMTLVRKRLS